MPEPSTLAIVVLGGISFGIRGRRSAGLPRGQKRNKGHSSDSERGCRGLDRGEGQVYGGNCGRHDPIPAESSQLRPQVSR
ncbi:MAG: PEP-CTERM sorting domain-containing protein [Verrucomicrobiales bacterium]